MDTLQGMCELFRGRLDAYGTNEGGCDASVKVDPHDGNDYTDWPAFEPEYRRRMRLHLSGEEPFGTYPLMDDLTVWWGCTDLDYTEDPTEAHNIATMLVAAGANGWVECSRSKGFHVWTFAYEPVAAVTMRNALLAIHQRLEVPAKEVNPKQVSFDGLKGYGNYVRTPYPGWASSTGDGRTLRQVMLAPDDSVYGLPDFVEEALAHRTTTSVYQAMADKYVPPPPPRSVDVDGEIPENLQELVPLMSRGTYLAYRYGPREGFDRSSSLARLAHLLHEDGFTPAETLALLRDSDDRCGQKFTFRGDGDDQLMKLVANAFQ